MRKILSLFMPIVLNGTAVLTITACQNPLSSGGDEKIPKPSPQVRDVSYYQNLILQWESDIIDCEKFLIEIRESTDYEKESERQCALDQTQAEEFDLKVQIAEAYFQILLLKIKGDPDQDQVLEAIVLLKININNLNQSLVLKIKYKDDFSDKEIKEIKDAIALANTKLKNYNLLKDRFKEKKEK